jgi:2-methylcitrate dehydratase PrpD
MNATKTLSQFVANSRYDDFDDSVVEAAKIAILDGVANMLAGSTQELASIVGRYVQDMGGSPQSSVVGWGFKTNAPSAAFANGVFGHCLDFEIQGYPPTHGTSSCLPAALALGEERHTNGKAIIEAYVMGWEIQGRLRAASAAFSNPAYHPPGLVGPLGGAVAGAKVLGLDAWHIQMAMGIAASRTGGLTANTGTMVKSTHTGNAARMGAEAAILAAAGYTSSDSILEAPNGYSDALFDGNMDWEILTNGLGVSYRLVDPGFDIKRFPAQLHMQNPIEAVLNLLESHNLRADDVENLTVHTGGRGHSGSLPASGLDGKFSIEYCAAAALLDGKVGIETFTDDRRFSPDMEETLGKIQVEPGNQDSADVKVTALLKDGRSAEAECRGFRGSARNPMSREERMDKVIDCVGRVLTDQDADRLVSLIEDLENVADISEIMDLIGRQPSV